MAKSNFLKRLDKINFQSIIHIITIVIVVLFIINLFFITSLTSSLKQKIAEAEESARPADLELTIITEASCANCFDINTVVDQIKSGNVNVTKEATLDASEAEQLIEDYNIEKLPTVIVKGELNKTNLNSTLRLVGDAFVFASQTPPYYDTNLHRVKGLVSATIINPDNCDLCVDVQPLLDDIESTGVVITRKTTLNERQAAELIEAYTVTRLPTFILSSDASEYTIIQENWAALGTEEEDGNLVLRNAVPPYKDLITGNIEGLVSLTYLIDSSCSECYNVSRHRDIIYNYGVDIINETTLDVAQPNGLAFARANDITLVPTVVVSKEAKLYDSFYAAFTQVSRELDDENGVFIAVELMGPYKDLETGEVVQPQQG